MKLRNATAKGLAGALILCFAGASKSQALPLDEHCVVSVLNRTARVQADGTWRIDNVPANMGLVRVRATRVFNGVTTFGQSDFILLEPNIANGFSPFELGNVDPTPTGLTITGPSVLTGIGNTAQLTATTTYPDNSTRDVTAAALGTSYTISNPNTATITPDGLVTAVASGTVVISGINDGAIGMFQLRVVLTGDSDGDGIADDLEIANGLNPNNPVDAEEDPDKDGLSNKEELLDFGTEIQVADTDADGILDGEEVAPGQDGFTTSPLLADTDADGVRDQLEVVSGSDPTNPSSLNLAQALQSLEVTPPSVVLRVNTIVGESSRQLTVTGFLKDGTTIDLTSTTRGTMYNSSDLFVANFGSPDGRVFAGNDGSATITVSNSGFSDTAEFVVTTFAPLALSAIPIPGYANNVDVNAGFAYVAAGAAGLQIVDVANPSAPVIIGSVDTPGNANDVRLLGSLAFVADGSSGLQVIDISTPASPIVVGSLDTPGEAQDVFVSGTRAYVADGASGLQIVDISTPSTPVNLGSIDTPGTAKGVAVSGTFAVVADGSPSSAVRVIDISNPASPEILGEVTVSGGEPKDLVVENNLAYVAAYTGGLRVVDFSDPDAPSIIGSLPSSFVPRDVELAGQFALLAEQLFPNAVPIVNVSVPSNPIFQTTINFSPFGDYAGTGIALDQQYVYMTGEFFIVGPENGVNGNTRLFIGQFLAIEDNEGVGPTVNLTFPSPGGDIIEGNTILVQAAASDDIGVAAVTFLVDGVASFTDTAAPFQFDFTVPLGASSVTFGAQAIDFGGNIGIASTVVANVIPNPPPTITITSPTETVIEGETIALSADATDDTTVASVLFTVNGVPQPLDTTPPFSVDFTVPTGIANLTVQATATDNASKQAFDTVTVSVIPDPLTTVIGQVLQEDGLPADGAEVSVFSVFTATTGPDGAFLIENVPTVLGNISARATLTVNGVPQSGISVPVPPVRGGVTLVGEINLKSGIRMLIVTADGSPPVDEMMASGFFDAVTVFFASIGTPTIDTLLEYDVVWTYSNSTYQNPDAVGNVLADYVDQGGKVLISTYAFSTPWAVRGRITTAGYSPLVNVGVNGNIQPPVVPIVPADPIFEGIDAVAMSFFWNSNFAHPQVAANATLLATDSAGTPMIARNAQGNVVGANLFPARTFGNDQEFYDLMVQIIRVLFEVSAPPPSPPE